VNVRVLVQQGRQHRAARAGEAREEVKGLLH
jgi:hypothetical protein